LCGEDPSGGLKKLKSLNKPQQLCGKMFKYGDPTFSCRYTTSICNNNWDR
jgi:E3 ubiquitin-protein ligase UBR2